MESRLPSFIAFFFSPGVSKAVRGPQDNVLYQSFLNTVKGGFPQPFLNYLSRPLPKPTADGSQERWVQPPVAQASSKEGRLHTWAH